MKVVIPSLRGISEILSGRMFEIPRKLGMTEKDDVHLRDAFSAFPLRRMRERFKVRTALATLPKHCAHEPTPGPSRGGESGFVVPVQGGVRDGFRSSPVVRRSPDRALGLTVGLQTGPVDLRSADGAVTIGGHSEL